MTSLRIVSRHLTKRGAELRRVKLDQERLRGRSSGNERVDYVVRRRGEKWRLRRWLVVARASWR